MSYLAVLRGREPRGLAEAQTELENQDALFSRLTPVGWLVCIAVLSLVVYTTDFWVKHRIEVPVYIGSLFLAVAVVAAVIVVSYRHDKQKEVLQSKIAVSTSLWLPKSSWFVVSLKLRWQPKQVALFFMDKLGNTLTYVVDSSLANAGELLQDFMAKKTVEHLLSVGDFVSSPKPGDISADWQKMVQQFKELTGKQPCGNMPLNLETMAIQAQQDALERGD